MLTVPLPPTLERGLARLSRDSERYWRHRPVIEPLSLMDRESASVLRVRLRFPDASEGHAFVKHFKPRGPSPGDRELMRARVVKDFTVTSGVHDSFRGNPDFSAARPIACFPEELILVTEEVAGEPLDALLERRAAWKPDSRTVDDLCELVSRIGAWFKAFQQIDPPEGATALGNMREYLELRLKRLTADPRGVLSVADCKNILAYFDARSRELAADDLIQCLVHGDVAPSNIIVHGRSIAIIDFAMACVGGRHLDIARLYTQLEFLKAKPKFRSRVVDRLQAALLSGFDHALRPHHPLFRLFELQHVICHVANLSLNPAPPVVRLYNKYQVRRHYRWLRERAA